MNKKIISVLFILVIIGGFVIWKTVHYSTNTIVIRIADPKAVGGALFHIAEEKKYFEEEGIQVEVVGVQTGDEALKALASNSGDIALGGLIPYSFFALDNQHLKIIATNAYVSDNQIIADSGKGIQKAEDLKGKKIGYTKTTASDIGLEQFLYAHGMQRSDVTLIDLKPLAMPGALKSGQIDAYSSWEPHVLNGKKLLGDSALIFTGEHDVYTWHQALMVSDTYSSSHADALKAFVRALQKAETFAKTNKEEAIQLASKHNGLSPDVLSQIWSKYDFSIALRDDLSSILATDLAWANAHRETKVSTVPSAESLIDHSILGYANKK